MYAGIAGLKTHMQNLNVIGNNIANINTYAYKAGRSVFRTAIYTQISGGRDGTSVVGSKNPSQIGYGSNLATVDIDMSTASYSPGKSTDVMIDGEGFFLLGDKETGNNIDPMNPNTLKSFTLTRVGDFGVGEDGYLKNGVGDVVYGFLVTGYVDGKPIYSDQLVPIRVPYQDRNENILWPSLQTVDEDGNIVGEDGGDADGETSLRLTDTRYYSPGGEDDTENQLEAVRAKLTNISIDENGIISGTDSNDEPIIIGALAMGTVDNPDGVTQLSSSYYKCGSGAGDLSINMVGGAGKSAYVKHTAGDLPGQGGEGEDEAYELPREYGSIQEGTGISLGMTYVNHSQVYANENAGGEETSLPDGSKVYDTSASKFQPGGLETSSTDLAKEIADMITTQRGYQANTRVITVTDSMLEELVNMKR